MPKMVPFISCIDECYLEFGHTLYTLPGNVVLLSRYTYCIPVLSIHESRVPCYLNYQEVIHAQLLIVYNDTPWQKLIISMCRMIEAISGAYQVALFL